MKIQLRKAHYLSFLWLLFALPSLLCAQDPYLQKANRKIMREAMAITRDYQPRLVMSADQALQFREKVAEFLIHRVWVSQNNDLTTEQKYLLLKRISSRETSEMADILESYRWDEYRRLKNQIQPIAEPSSNRNDIVDGTTNQ
ncbi:MAG: hypothetical protein WBN18_15035 [Flavobacteriaceae bacterium]